MPKLALEELEEEFYSFAPPEYNEDIEALQALFNFPLKNDNDFGNAVSRYNGALRFDVLRDPKSCIIKNPKKFLDVIRYVEKISGIKPSHGIKIKDKSSAPLYVHLLVEYENGSSIGVFYFDAKRTLAITQIHQVERAINAANLSGALIICNLIGLIAQEETDRINKFYGEPGIISIQRYDTIRNTLQPK
jgi:hypothetical protein